MSTAFYNALLKLGFHPKNKDVIEKTGYDSGDISRWLRGKSEPPNNFVLKFCEVYNLDVAHFAPPSVDEWKEKYYALLEKYNHCLEQQQETKSPAPAKGAVFANPTSKHELK